MRPILLGMLIAASCAASPVPQAATEGEALYRKMEAAVTGAKKLTVEFTATADGATVTGTFVIDEGNKLDLKVAGTSGVKKYDLKIKCDGQKMSLERSETPAPPVPLEPQPELPAPANFTANVAASFARGGAWLAQEFADVEYRRAADPWFIERQKAKEEQGRKMKPVPPPPLREASSLHDLRNFRSGDGGSIRYDLVPKGENPPVVLTVTVWVDAKGMPTKREGQYFATKDGKPAGESLSKWNEIYKY